MVTNLVKRYDSGYYKDMWMYSKIVERKIIGNVWSSLPYMNLYPRVDVGSLTKNSTELSVVSPTRKNDRNYNLSRYTDSSLSTTESHS